MGIIRMVHLKELLKDRRVIEEINRHLWIESQKAGYSVGLEHAAEEWLALYAEAWLKYHDPARYEELVLRQKKIDERRK